MGINRGYFKDSEEMSPNEVKEAEERARVFRIEQKTSALDRAKNHYTEAREIQDDFRRRLSIIGQNGDEMSQKEFEKWEDCIAGEIGYAKEELRQWTDSRLETVADCEKSMLPFSMSESDCSTTIEAQAGRFFNTRIQVLIKAIQEVIRKSDGETIESGKNDLEYIRSFYPVVARYLDFLYMSKDDTAEYGYAEYDKDRTWAHNMVIKHINGLNDLAIKYGVRPLTIRNFWPSDIRRKNDQTLAVSRVMRYDRDVVEAYYTIAFSEDIKQRERRESAKQRLFR
ncbi:hypothetical protein IKG10_01530 [Candidatus Saccharibacteria bacterium]|nr:hypothetical protein [Candidatus Saccharibacteria bacterium]